MPSFTYKPLDLKRSEFRLVRLQKGKAYQIDCELIHAVLDDNVIAYEAVSYTWGSSQKSYTISIQGATFNVTYHLWCVLHDLQQAETDRYLWIDAISIDQENIAERGHQVQQMKEIYGTADRVLFCLGLVSDHSTDVFMASVKDLQIKVRGFRGRSDDPRCKDAWREVQKMLHLRYGDEYERLQREGLQRVLRQQWFRRVWILQEAASARKALVYYNTDSVSSYVFVMSIQLIGISLDEHTEAVIRLMPGPPYSSNPTFRRDLYSLLIQFPKSEASDPRDKIFALLGLRTDGGKFSPDYSLSVYELINELNEHLFGKMRPAGNEYPVGFEHLVDLEKAPRGETIGQYLSALQDIHHQALTGDMETAFTLLSEPRNHETIISLLKKQINPISVTQTMFKMAAQFELSGRMMELFLKHSREIDIDAKALIPNQPQQFDRLREIAINLLQVKEKKVVINATLRDLRQLLFLIPQDNIMSAVMVAKGVDNRAHNIIWHMRQSLSSVPDQFPRIIMINTFLQRSLRPDAELAYLLLVAVKFMETEIVKLLFSKGAKSRSLWSSKESGKFAWLFVTHLLANKGTFRAYSGRHSPFRNQKLLKAPTKSRSSVTPRPSVNGYTSKVQSKSVSEWKYGCADPDCRRCIKKKRRLEEKRWEEERWEEEHLEEAPLVVETSHQNQAIAAVLLEANVFSKYEIIETWPSIPEPTASIIKNWEISRYFLYRGEFLGFENYLGSEIRGPVGLESVPLLHQAAQEGYLWIVQLLLEAGADVTGRDDQQKTPLHYAAKRGHFSVVRLLLDSGADESELASIDERMLRLVRRLR